VETAQAQKPTEKAALATSPKELIKIVSIYDHSGV